MPYILWLTNSGSGILPYAINVLQSVDLVPGVHVSTKVFIAWLCDPASLREHLCQKFPEFKNEIRKQFADWPSLRGPLGGPSPSAFHASDEKSE